MGALSRRIAKIKAEANRKSYAKRMMHPAFAHLLIGVPVSAVRTLQDDGDWPDELIERVCDYYVWAHAQAGGSGPSMWDEHEVLRNSFIDALKRKDLGVLRKDFKNLFQSILLDGMSHGNSLFALEERNPYQKDFFPLRTIDCLLSLAEASGTSPVPSYAQMKLLTYVKALQPDYAALMSQVEEQLGFSLDMPMTGSPYVCDLGTRETAADVVRHAYVAHRLKALGLSATSHIVEIGGGFGMLALCANRAGFNNFTIVDLPFVGAIQMGYLGSALGADVVSGGNETPAALNVVPPEGINDFKDNSVDIVINCDSLPEMGEETALNYIRHVHRISGRFLSINQEAQKVHGGVAQNWVSQLVDQVGGFRRVYRFRHWMEQGYVEELYERV